MLNYLIIADVSSENQKVSYYKLCEYLFNLNPTHSQVYFIEFNNDMPNNFEVHTNGNYQQIHLNNFFQNQEENVFNLCKSFIQEYANDNNTVFILIDCCLINSPLNNISFNQYYSQEYTYRIYDKIWEYINSIDGTIYKNNTNWACFSRGNVLLDYLSRALIKYKDKVLERYTIKNIAWYDHLCNDNEVNDINNVESILSFNEPLKIAISQIE